MMLDKLEDIPDLPYTDLNANNVEEYGPLIRQMIGKLCQLAPTLEKDYKAHKQNVKILRAAVIEDAMMQAGKGAKPTVKQLDAAESLNEDVIEAEFEMFEAEAKMNEANNALRLYMASAQSISAYLGRGSAIMKSEAY